MTKWLDGLAKLVATGLGSGYSPVAPGTAGSLVGLLLFLPLAGRAFSIQLAAVAAVTILGVLRGRPSGHDARARRIPGVVVVDEVAGQWITFPRAAR
jgi:phosphatidylglycerophosphatase A